MTFLAPLMLLGLVGVAIPLVIHLIGRRRARVVKFAALAFLIGSKRKTSRRLQLRERLLLLVRLLACVALPLAIAKPFTSCRARGRGEVEQAVAQAQLLARQLGRVGRALRRAHHRDLGLGPELDQDALGLGPGERRSKRFLATLPEGRRAATVEVEIADRGLGLDDRRRVRAVLREQIHVLLVDGDARTTRHDDELFYLHAALRPGDRNDAGTDVESMTPEDLGKSELDAYDVIVLANVPALPAEQVARLAAWVRSGGGLWITAGDQLDAAAYEATMLPLLPQGVKDPIDTGWGATAADRASRALGLGLVEELPHVRRQ